MQRSLVDQAKAAELHAMHCKYQWSGLHLTISQCCTGSGERFELEEPQLRLQQIALRLLGCQQRSAQALLQTAVSARKAGQLMNGMAAINELHAMLQGAQSAIGPGCACRGGKPG